MRVGTRASCYTELGASPLCGVIWGMSPASLRLHISVHSPPTAAGRMKCERSFIPFIKYYQTPPSWPPGKGCSVRPCPPGAHNPEGGQT